MKYRQYQLKYRALIVLKKNLSENMGDHTKVIIIRLLLQLHLWDPSAPVFLLVTSEKQSLW